MLYCLFCDWYILPHLYLWCWWIVAKWIWILVYLHSLYSVSMEHRFSFCQISLPKRFFLLLSLFLTLNLLNFSARNCSFKTEKIVAVPMHAFVFKRNVHRLYALHMNIVARAHIMYTVHNTIFFLVIQHWKCEEKNKRTKSENNIILAFLVVTNIQVLRSSWYLSEKYLYK